MQMKAEKETIQSKGNCMQRNLSFLWQRIKIFLSFHFSHWTSSSP